MRDALDPWAIGLLLMTACAAPGGDRVPREQESESGAEPERERARLADRLRVVPSEFVGIADTPSADPHVGGDPGLPPGTAKEDGEFVLAPIPFLNPTIGYGLVLGGAYMVPFDAESPPSVIGGGAMASQNGSWAGALAFKGYFAADRYRVAVGLVRTDVLYDYSLPTFNVPLRMGVTGAVLEVLVRSFERVYFGPQLLFSGIDTDLVKDGDSGALPEDELEANSLGVGLRLQRDTRDSTFYPRSGSLADIQLRVYDPDRGSRAEYEVVPFGYDHYLGISEQDVLALRAAGRFSFGDVPFYGESFLGAGPDLRAYAVGSIHDDLLVAAQAEWRRQLTGSWGAVLFAGAGTVAGSLDELDDGDLYPSAGLGLRYLLEPENHVNFRVDYAWGDGQSALYIGVGEAF